MLETGSCIAAFHRKLLTHALSFLDAPYMGFKGCRSSCSDSNAAIWPNVPAALPAVLDTVTECRPEDRATVGY